MRPMVSKIGRGVIEMTLPCTLYSRSFVFAQARNFVWYQFSVQFSKV